METETQLKGIEEQTGGEEMKPTITDNYFNKVSYIAAVEGKEKEVKGKFLRLSTKACLCADKN